MLGGLHESGCTWQTWPADFHATIHTQSLPGQRLQFSCDQTSLMSIIFRPAAAASGMQSKEYSSRQLQSNLFYFLADCCSLTKTKTKCYKDPTYATPAISRGPEGPKTSSMPYFLKAVGSRISNMTQRWKKREI